MKPFLISIVLITSFFSSNIAQENSIAVHPHVQKFIGDISELNRQKFFNAHIGGTDKDIEKFYTDYNVTPGRGFWGPFSYAKQKTKTVGQYPEFSNKKCDLKEVDRKISTEHPKAAFKDGIDIKNAGKWAAEYFKNHAGNTIPEFFEPMNEPFVHAKNFYKGKWNVDEINRIKKQMSEFYAACGKEIHNTPSLANMKVIGYSSAWPSVELKNFNHWETGMKMFMDTAGKHMDGFATHLYDGVNIEGQNNIRSGSNAEAILDLIETYSYIKWNKIKPHAISEYGAIEKGYGKAYSDMKSIQSIRAINHILFSLLDREDRMLISIPFITGKAKWHINEANEYHPYLAVLFRPKTIEKTDNPKKPLLKDWTYTSRIHFYDLWKDVKGKRVQIKGSNPDIQYQAFVEGNKLHIALSNLDDIELTTDLKINSDIDFKIKNVRKKSLKIFDREDPIFKNEIFEKSPREIKLLPHETVVLTIEYQKTINFSEKIQYTNVYSKNHLQPIKSNEDMIFTFNKVPEGIQGKAILKMGIGRKHDKSKKPILIVNGAIIDVPTNWKGYDQKNRKDFFGVIDIPIPMSYLKSTTTITLRFPDDSGRVSSMILQTELKK